MFSAKTRGEGGRHGACADPADMESLEGQLLAGKYRVERVLGKGGMGVVVAAIHQQLDQRVALKFMVPSALKDTQAVGRFLREARSAVRLASEHVARVIDVGTLENGAPFIVMEYLEGCDLAGLVAERGPLPIPEAVDYVLQTCEALAEAHSAGIVHRDLKPANLFLTHRRDCTPCIKVLDFGIAKISGRDSALAQTTGAIGTPFYMSPEQMKSARTADARSDIWSLGIVLYELLTGDLVYARETLPALCAAILNDPPPAIRQRRPEVPARLEAVITRCLQKEPDDRYQSVGELARALSEFADDAAHGNVSRVERILATSVPSVRVASGSQVDHSAPTERASQTGIRLPMRKLARAEWLALAGVVAVAVLGAFLQFRASGVEAATSTLNPVSSLVPEAPPKPSTVVVPTVVASHPVAASAAPQTSVAEPKTKRRVVTRSRMPREPKPSAAPASSKAGFPSLPGDYGDRK